MALGTGVSLGIGVIVAVGVMVGVSLGVGVGIKVCPATTIITSKGVGVGGTLDGENTAHPSEPLRTLKASTTQRKDDLRDNLLLLAPSTTKLIKWQQQIIRYAAHLLI